MRSRILAPLTLAPLTLLAIATALAWPHAATASADAKALRLTEKIVSFTELDLGKPGLSQGDALVYRSDLLDERARRVGTSGGECVSVAPKGGTLGLTQCNINVVLKGGQLAVVGPYDLNAKSGELAVVGGTGRYRGVTGQMDYVTTEDAETFKLTIRLNG